jgi:hypothetical protein
LVQAAWGRFTRPRTREAASVFPLRRVGDDYTYAVSPDGRRFLVNMVVRDSASPIVIVLNWTADLKP